MSQFNFHVWTGLYWFCHRIRFDHSVYDSVNNFQITTVGADTPCRAIHTPANVWDLLKLFILPMTGRQVANWPKSFGRSIAQAVDSLLQIIQHEAPIGRCESSTGNHTSNGVQCSYYISRILPIQCDIYSAPHTHPHNLPQRLTAICNYSEPTNSMRVWQIVIVERLQCQIPFTRDESGFQNQKFTEFLRKTRVISHGLRTVVRKMPKPEVRFQLSFLVVSI